MTPPTAHDDTSTDTDHDTDRDAADRPPFVCGECGGLVPACELGDHRRGHDVAGLTFTRRDFVDDPDTTLTAADIAEPVDGGDA